MRLPLAVGIGGTLLVAASAVLLWPDTPTVVRVPPVKAAAQPAAEVPPQAVPVAVPAAEPAPVARPDGLALQGVMARAEAGRSEALLSKKGAAAELYRVGETVADGWVLRRVAPDHVVLARAGAEARIELAGQPVPAATQAAADKPPQMAPPTAARSPTGQEVAPGFMAGTAPPRTVSGTPESNRRFLQDRRERMAATSR